jgi:uncharacterized protein
MIIKIIPLLILLMVLPDYYIDHHFLKRKHCTLLKRALWWIPSTVMMLFTVFLCCVNTFEPSMIGWLNAYLFLFGIIVVPKSFFSLFSSLGVIFCRLFHSMINWGNIIGIVFALISLYIVIYGSFLGLDRLNVRHVDYSSSSLPAAFDGYRIVQFSDAHVGTYTSSHQQALIDAIDSINAQKADAIMFCGDLIDLEPAELSPYLNLLNTLHAPDGVFSIMGNHDYPMYMKSLDNVQKIENLKELQSRERQFGWNLLLNDHHAIHRGQDSIIVAGEENDGRPPFPALADARQTLQNVNLRNFVIMLQHDPSAWRRNILPRTPAQLTLSGHTHAMQFELFGWSPASLMYQEWGGMFYEGERAIIVSTGLGGVIPFRFGAWPEIVVITLHTSK